MASERNLVSTGALRYRSSLSAVTDTDHTSAGSLAAQQLSRMRGMTVEYHRQFFTDVRFAMAVMLALFVVGFWVSAPAFLLIPFVALWAAVQTSFDASYLLFARHYAVRLERYLNERAGEQVLLGGKIEDNYLFPLGTRKIVTIELARRFSWFGYVTIFFTMAGVVAYGYGLALGWTSYLSAQTAAWRVSYLTVLAALTLVSLVTGMWWFVGGVGERRIEEALGDFGLSEPGAAR